MRTKVGLSQLSSLSRFGIPSQFTKYELYIFPPYFNSISSIVVAFVKAYLQA